MEIHVTFLMLMVDLLLYTMLIKNTKVKTLNVKKYDIVYSSEFKSKCFLK